MNDSDEQYAAKLRQRLDAGAADLKPGIAYRLQQARQAALARLSPEHEMQAGGALAGARPLAGAGGASMGGGPPIGRPLYAQRRVWIVALVLAAAAFGWQQWTAWQELADLEDLDVQILTSELPIDAFVDRGFQQWLRTPSLSE
jgi:hypothetical protein